MKMVWQRKSKTEVVDLIQLRFLTRWHQGTWSGVRGGVFSSCELICQTYVTMSKATASASANTAQETLDRILPHRGDPVLPRQGDDRVNCFGRSSIQSVFSTTNKVTSSSGSLPSRNSSKEARMAPFTAPAPSFAFS